MANLMQRISALLLAIIDRPEQVPPDIYEAAEELDPLVVDAINGNLDPLEDDAEPTPPL